MSRNGRTAQTSIQVKRAVGGDRESLEWVFAHLSPLVEAQVRFRLGSLGRNAADVEDLVAEVWTVVIGKMSSVRPRDGHYAPVLARFLGSTATNLCNNFLRREARRRTASLVDPAGERDDGLQLLARETRSVLTRAYQTELGGLIREALKTLSAEKRQVLVLRLLEHRTNAEIASVLGLPRNTIAVRYRRALDELRLRLPESAFAEIWDLRSGLER